MKKLLSLLVIVIAIISILFHSCRKDKDIIYNNKSPIAIAGIDQVTILPKDSVVLNGSASKDPDGTITQYNWTKIAGPASCVVVHPASATTVVRSLVPGVYRFELAVTDNSGAIGKDVVQVTVSTGNGINVAPVVSAGPDQNIALPSNSCLVDGGESYDPDGVIISYLWTKLSGPAPVLFSDPTAVTTWVHNLVGGVYQFELVVTDDKGAAGKDTVQVTVANPGNVAPVANAGLDIIIQLPVDFCNLNGQNSNDPDGTIVAYKWSKVSGPWSYSIVNDQNALATVGDLLEGEYHFELSVTDNDGLTAKDTMQVAVLPSDCNTGARPPINFTLTEIGTLMVARSPNGAAAGNKVVFAGGASGTAPGGGWGTHTVTSDAVDIFDVNTYAHTTYKLSRARNDIAAISCGNKIFFAGGMGGELYYTPYRQVDIYDVGENKWTVELLSEARSAISAGIIGNKVFFAGGTADWMYGKRTVDIYNLSTGQWSTAQLSHAKWGVNVFTRGDKIYFAGGEDFFQGYNSVDVYDNATGIWSTSSMEQLNGLMATITVQNTHYELYRLDKKVEVRNEAGAVIGRNCLTAEDSKFWLTRNNDLVFEFNYGSYGNAFKSEFNTFNIASGVWSAGKINPLPYSAAAVSSNNKVFLGGGLLGSNSYSNKVYRLDW